MASSEEIAFQQTLLATHRRNLSHYLKQQVALGGEAYTPPGVANGILEARSNIQRIKQILRGWNIAVDDHVYDQDSEPLPIPVPPVPARESTSERVRLRQILIEHFNDEELRDLLFEMNWDYDNLPGTGKSGKARELIAMAERYQRLPELVAHIKRLRNNIAW